MRRRAAKAAAAAGAAVADVLSAASPHDRPAARRHAWLAAAMTAPMAMMPAVLVWQEAAVAGGGRLAAWAGAGVAALAMAGTVAGIDALLQRRDA